MAVIAVAGGSNGLGLTIVEALKARGKHEIIILSRKDNPGLEKRLETRFVAVNYKDVESVQSVLEANDVDTVICTINSSTDLEPERNLIRAADRSRITRRIIPSIFAGFPYPIKYPDSNVVAKSKSEMIKEVQKTSLEYTVFYNGIFLDYYGSPHFKSHVPAWPMFVDISHESAAIPGSGNELIVFTHSSDIAEFTVRSLDLLKWAKESYVIGEKLSWNEFVKLAEDAKGSKFNIVYDSEADLKAGRVSQLPSYSEMYTASPGVEVGILVAGEWFAKAELDLKPTHSLNDDFPEIKPMRVMER
ncbi:hypothetical protein DL95DRAFT_460057 [Leptodontidium sp. 2 PMI_412]|nr:hypothetical protein DL95DRAFT_460057 [Leptodontidium sp. 2 PMI_412]